MIVNYRVNYCQFEVNVCFWLIRMQRRCISELKQNLVNYRVGLVELVGLV